jgi:UDP-N-acetylglucosamine 2-epimerase (non-hydrolysing)
LTTDPDASSNLAREGIDPAKVHFVGNVMIDTLLAHRERARALDVPAKFDLAARSYTLLTLHRPSNVDNAQVFERLVDAIAVIARDAPIIFPVHPRTRPVVSRSTRAAALVAEGRLRLIDPLGYLEFIGLMEQSRAVLTDSGGVQEETTILGVPCLTMRENTERPITITHGTNRLVGTDPRRILDAWRALAATSTYTSPPLWDGQAAGRIARILEVHAETRTREVVSQTG